MLTRILLITVAALAIAGGWLQLFRFASTPGDQAAAPRLWPQQLASAGFDLRPAKSSLLVVFIHPGCSCTRATLQQLDEVLGSANSPVPDPSQPSVQVVLAVYRSKNLDAQHLAAYSAAPWLHHAYRLISDPDGALAHRFGAATSGEVVLYSPSGHLLFQGGITSERGHLGESLGSGSLRAALSTGMPQSQPASVFGCPIFRVGHSG